ncbi:hypothetical protein PF010_g5786 [Phytophthora fragariae]|uniref:No apical meristem-associated C-terminal domain-containing protein n=1 Tax=Phytophthora fragariae TaxID=53985 RepID=A0A6A3SXC3_9STRA|nr:hypothetical protein PF003_g26912 [Phytophthora fragariae]KAE8942887.1 hypothetical protein PF009_g7372 [Phytophthora fragariae]KAE9020161.1 hypothetical protein PF011_g5529 [Phytophthora fragariae]KAE9124973.1 hypothetical protein PF010_g5786 [Phytophthora fragariae]KAE9125276.1 hypothetical protein PF007_g6402 [Phytophthora fragariae]
MGKKSSFLEEEEAQLCRSYLKVGTDATTGTNQSSGTFWERICTHFNSSRSTGSTTRDQRSLECKWSKVSSDVKRFASALDKVDRRSGASLDDEIEASQCVYKAMQGGTEAKTRKPFKLMHCWRILKAEPLWMSFRVSKPGYESTAPVNIDMAGPTSAELAQATKEMAQASRKRARAIEEANEMALFTVCLSDLDPDAREFFALRRHQVLQNLRDGPRNGERGDSEARVEVHGDAATTVTQGNAPGGIPLSPNSAVETARNVIEQALV